MGMERAFENRSSSGIERREHEATLAVVSLAQLEKCLILNDKDMAQWAGRPRLLRRLKSGALPECDRGIGLCLHRFLRMWPGGEGESLGVQSFRSRT